MNALEDLLRLGREEKQKLGLTHTPAEIAQQPDTWAGTMAIFQQRRAEIREFLGRVGIGSSAHERPIVFLIGAGTSDYVGRCLEQLLRRQWQCEIAAVPSTDLLPHGTEYLLRGRRYLWISFSRSGESPEGVAVLRRALSTNENIHHLIVTCSRESQMVRESSGDKRALSISLSDEVNDRGLAMTSSFSNLVVFGQCLAYAFNDDEFERFFPQIVEAGASFLPIAANCAASLAGKSYRKVVFVGSGPLAATAREAALKVMELTAGGTQTMWESSLGLRHGPMAALKPEDLFVCFLSSDEQVQKYELDLLREIARKNLVGARVVIGSHQKMTVNGLADHYLSPLVNYPLPDEFRPPVDVMFGQLLGLFTSLRCNLKPDSPSPTGAISRVVGGITIY